VIGGRPRSNKNQRAKQGARNANTATAALTDPDVAREAGRAPPKPKRKSPRKKAERRHGLLRAIMTNKLLTLADRQAIQQAHDEPVTPELLAALVAFELKLAERLYLAGELDAKALMVAVNKVTSHAAASVQLSTGAGGSGGANVVVTFTDTGPTSVRPEIKNHTPPDPTVGDIIDTDG
jgi:hypothetical protein